jgi:EAL domain-containing protein (putative c-di-GMP-specific phosphodiesterase class I)
MEGNRRAEMSNESSWTLPARTSRLQRWAIRRHPVDRDLGRLLDDEILRDQIGISEFGVYYQLVVARDGTPAGAKALLRWFRPGKGVQDASSFLPEVRNHEVHRRFTEVVLNHVAAALPAVRSLLAIDAPYISVSASAMQFEDRLFASRLAASLNANGASPNGLAVELTNPAAVIDWKAVAETSAELAHLGVKVAVEDSGSEPGDLLYRDGCDAAIVRIDRSMVEASRRWAHERDVVEATLALCSASDIRTVVQGVEDRHTLDWLRACGADFLTGYAIAQPEPLESLLDRLSSTPSPVR